MKREDAIEKFGVRYVSRPVEIKKLSRGVLTAGIHNAHICEELGAANGKYCYETVEDAIEQSSSRFQAKIRESLDWIEEWENSRATKLSLVFARAGLKRDSAGYLERVKKHYDTGERLAELLEQGIETETEYLPDEIKMPVFLEPGTKIYKVEAFYISDFEDPEKPPLTEHEITSVKLNPYSNEYDYVFDYKLDSGENFKYPKDRVTDEPIEGAVMNYHYFFSREAAEQHLSKLAERISETVSPYINKPKLEP